MAFLGSFEMISLGHSFIVLYVRVRPVHPRGSEVTLNPALELECVWQLPEVTLFPRVSHECLVGRGFETMSISTCPCVYISDLQVQGTHRWSHEQLQSVPPFVP